MKAEVRPYLVPQPETVRWGPWMLLDSNEWRSLPEAVEGWDPGTELRIARHVYVNVERFVQETGLDIAEVALTVSWTSSTTDMRDSTTPVGFDSSGAAVVDVTLAGERLSGTLTLRSTVSLARGRDGREPGVAVFPGSVLAEQNQQVVLENLSTMFPVHEIDFSHTRLSPAASWHLETTTDLTAPFYGTFRVLINKLDGELSSAISRGVKDKRQEALLDELQAGVAELLLELALQLRTELNEFEEWPVDSVGDVLKRTLSTAPPMANAPPSAAELSDYRTEVSAAVRRLGRGRVFR